MTKAAWSFVDYTCGHSAPVQRGGGDRKAPRLCPDCARDLYKCFNPVCPLAHPHAPYSRAVDDSRAS